MADNILEIRHLSKSFGTHEVLRDIDFTVSKGDVISIIGASGSGKSTLLRCINLLETPSSGEILYHGENVTGKSVNAAKYRSHVGMVFQSFNLFNNMTVLKNCMVGQMKVLGRSKDEAHEQAMRYLEKVGMAPYVNAKPRQLSGGQKQRVAIARALATNPRYLLCDEATSALDPNTTRSILELLREINKTLGVTIIVITHEMKVIDQICDRVAVIDKSCIAEEGRVADVFTSPKSDIARELVLPQERPVLEPTTGGRKVRIIFNGDGYADEWIKAAEKRGLLNLPTTADTLPHYLDPKNIALFERHKIFTESELRSRYEILIENYNNVNSIEAYTMLSIVRKQILPSALEYTRFLSETLNAKKMAMEEADTSVEKDLIQMLSSITANAHRKTRALHEAMKQSVREDKQEEAYFFKNTILPLMEDLRSDCDQLETYVAKEFWKFPTYGDILYYK